MSEKIQKLGISEPIASPSRPSVKLTALQQPIMIKMAQGMNRIPKSGFIFLKKGKVMVVDAPVIYNQATTTVSAHTTCNQNFAAALMPDRRLILHQSSQAPMAPKRSKQSNNIHTCAFDKSHHKSVLRITNNKINTPPIVGILSFNLCESGVHSRAFARNHSFDVAINQPPSTHEKTSVLNNDAMARTLT